MITKGRSPIIYWFIFCFPKYYIGQEPILAHFIFIFVRIHTSHIGRICFKDSLVEAKQVSY